MSQKSIILTVCLFALIIIGMFVYAQLKKNELTEVVVVPSTVPTVSDAYVDVTQIDAKHYFIDGTHTVVGEINMPTPCDLLEYDAIVMESFPEQVTLNFSVLNTAESCVQTITPQRFRIEFSASIEATMHAVFMGRDVTLNLIPAAAGETPEEFELFFKG